jgi:hypothetical protein
MGRFKTDLLPVILITALSVAIYLSALPNDFLHDDVDQIVKNPWLADLGNIPKVFFSSVWSFLKEKVTSNYYRPMMHVIYMLDYRLFGLDPWGFHLTSIVINAANACMLFFLTRRLILDHDAEREILDFNSATLASLSAAMLFTAHPVHTESVAWAASIPELSFSFFFLISFYFYIRFQAGDGPRSLFYALSVFSFFVSTFCKEPALLLPLLFLSYDFFLRREPVRPFLPWILRYAPYAIAGFVYIGMRVYALSGFAPREPAHFITKYEAFLNVFPLVFDYFKALAWPVSLNFFHTFKAVHSAFEPRTIVGIAFTAALVIAMFLLSRRRRLTLFALLWIIIPLLPSFYIEGLGRNTFAERYLYLPTAGFTLVIAMGIVGALLHLRGRGGRVFVILIVLVATALYSAATYRRNFVYRNELTLWADTVKKSPDNGFVHMNVGIAYAKHGDDDSAIAEYEKALESVYLEADAALTLFNMANAYQRKGMSDEAIHYYLRTVAVDPAYIDAYNNLGGVYALRDDIDSAIACLRKALEIQPDHEQARLNLERALALKAGSTP